MIYARQPVARTAAGWVVGGNVAMLAANASFPVVVAGVDVATFFGVGRDLAGAGELLFFGPIVPPIAIAPGVTPTLGAGSSVSQLTPDGMASIAAEKLMELLFNNVDWTFIGDLAGILGSALDGNFYLSLHNATPTEAGTQASFEIGYT